MSNIEIEKQIVKIKNELAKDFSQYSERVLFNKLISLQLDLKKMNKGIV